MDEVTRLRKLRAVESAAASAVLNGCDPAEVRRRVEVGIAEAIAVDDRGSVRSSVERPSSPGQAQRQAGAASPAGETSALDAWTSAVGGQRAA